MQLASFKLAGQKRANQNACQAPAQMACVRAVIAAVLWLPAACLLVCAWWQGWLSQVGLSSSSSSATLNCSLQRVFNAHACSAHQPVAQFIVCCSANATAAAAAASYPLEHSRHTTRVRPKHDQKCHIQLMTVVQWDNNNNNNNSYLSFNNSRKYLDKYIDKYEACKFAIA